MLYLTSTSTSISASYSILYFTFQNFVRNFVSKYFVLRIRKMSDLRPFRSVSDPENPIRKFTSSQRHLILFLYTVSNLQAALVYVRSRTYTARSANFFCTFTFFTFARTYVPAHTSPVRTVMLRSTVTFVRTYVRAITPCAYVCSCCPYGT